MRILKALGQKLNEIVRNIFEPYEKSEEEWEEIFKQQEQSGRPSHNRW